MHVVTFPIDAESVEELKLREAAVTNHNTMTTSYMIKHEHDTSLLALQSTVFKAFCELGNGYQRSLDEFKYQLLRKYASDDIVANCISFVVKSNTGVLEVSLPD